MRVRFAPSPTGHLHIGGARTALFNWLFARHHGGAFILRIEDTDRSRSTDETITSIVDALGWLGLDWDEGPPAPGYRQTERMDLYRAHAARLLAAGRAYYCDCPPEMLERERQEAERRKETFRYSGRCRGRGLTMGALRLRIPAEGATVVNDLIHGPVTFEHRQLDDWILVRTDGTPTYNFCVVVDDVTMRITHVIRGNDHLSNTPKQILCYEALDYLVPEFAHVSMILGADRRRLSKRHGATSVQAFREAGILPEAMVNYLARLGWAHGDQEVFSREDLVELFDIKHVGASGAVFDQAKLEWLSQEYVKRLPAADLARRLGPFLAAAGLVPRETPGWLEGVVETLRERAKTLVEMVERGRFYFERPAGYDPKPAPKFLTAEGARRLRLLAERLAADRVFTAASIEAVYRGLIEALGLTLVDLAQLTRLAVTGTTASPPIFDVLALLGREETVARLATARAVAEAVR
ncbi:MAG: glutamate--tRNA ligase [Candidatus Rokubacteria bacterium]|nr:glutamate--tRNA ligase [Candidatus Rokubacteria bacterium]MBI3827551.1 glutamate--tRNA ligase [Candidatus Rokubacteria bacterium]